MDNLGFWLMMSISFFIILTSKLKGRANGIAVWIYLWAMAGVNALFTWRVYQNWVATSANPDPDPFYHTKFPQMIWWSLLEIVVLLVLPVVWYRNDLRKERADGNPNPPV